MSARARGSTVTSRASSSECFVYITLPGQVSPVTAGRFVLDKNARGDALGRFVYGRSYLENPAAVEFDPVELKLSTRTYETAQLSGGNPSPVYPEQLRASKTEEGSSSHDGIESG